MPSPVACKSANSPGSPDFFTAFWIEGVSVTGAISVSLNSGTVTARSTPGTDTWIVGQYSTANTASGIAGDGNVEVATVAYAAGTTPPPAPVITIDIDPNGGECKTAKITGLYMTWGKAPNAGDCRKNGWGFRGWNTSADGSGIAIGPDGDVYFTGDNRIYAQYIDPYQPVFPAGPPTDLVATPSWGTVKVSWKAPTYTGSYPITNYLAQATPGGQVCITRLTDKSLTDCEFTSLTPGVKYTFTAQALNGAGWGDRSVAGVNSVATPQGIKVTDFKRAKRLLGLAGTKLVISGDAPGYAAGSRLAVWMSTKNPDKWERRGDVALNGSGKFEYSTTFGRDMNDRSMKFRFTVDGTNYSKPVTVGPGASNLVFDKPSAPRNLTSTGWQGWVQVRWEPPAKSGDGPITGYEVTSSPGGLSCKTGPSASKCSFSYGDGVKRGVPYTFTVKAVNSGGAGAGATTPEVARAK